MNTSIDIRLLKAVPMARRLGISPNWLRMEAIAGRLPHIDAGGVILFDPIAVEQALRERATHTNTRLEETSV